MPSDSGTVISDGAISSTAIDDGVAVEATVDQFGGGPGGGGGGNKGGTGGSQPCNPS